MADVRERCRRHSLLARVADQSREPGQATPMTYTLKGKQYLVIAAGGHGKLGSKQGDYVIAFTLP